MSQEKLQELYKSVPYEDLIIARYHTSKDCIAFNVNLWQGVELTHIPTGIVVHSGTEYKYDNNMDKAIDILRKRLETVAYCKVKDSAVEYVCRDLSTGRYYWKLIESGSMKHNVEIPVELYQTLLATISD